MHEFNVTIKLEDKDYCNGCRSLHLSDVYPISHTYCKFYEAETRTKYVGNKSIQQMVVDGNQAFGWQVHRPDICKQNDKEKTK